MSKLIQCSEWLKLHSHTENYLQILIDKNQIAPAQADWIVKNIIIDESGYKYPSDDDPEYPCNLEIWCDLQDIPGYFSKKELEPNSEMDQYREEKYQHSKPSITTMVKKNNIDWNRQKIVFKFSNTQDCKKWLLGKLKDEGLI